MKVKYYGPRGSLPTPGKSTVKYGGNTTCLLLRAGGQPFIVDGGSGLRVLGQELMATEFGKGKGEAVFFWTHFHWDHIMGFPFFTPNFIPGNKITHYGSPQVQEVLKRQQEFVNFPVEFAKMPSQHGFHTLPGTPVTIKGLQVESCRSLHPAGGMIYKFSWEGKSLVFATDTEHPEQGLDQELVRLCQKADILIYDAQYTPEEYARGRKSWGHSTWEQGVAVAKAAQVKQLHLYHHDPVHTDTFLERQILFPARRAFKKTFLAREGWEFGL